MPFKIYRENKYMGTLSLAIVSISISITIGDGTDTRSNTNQIWPRETRNFCRTELDSDKLQFLQSHMKRKGLSKSLTFKSPHSCPSATSSAQDVTRVSTDSEMEISMASDVTHHQRTIANPTHNQKGGRQDTEAMEHLKEMKVTISTFMTPRTHMDSRLTFYKCLY